MPFSDTKHGRRCRSLSGAPPKAKGACTPTDPPPYSIPALRDLAGVIATSAAELTAGSGDSAKPKAASRTASLSDPLSARAIGGLVLRRKRRSRACQFCVDRERIVVQL